MSGEHVCLAVVFVLLIQRAARSLSPFLFTLQIISLLRSLDPFVPKKWLKYLAKHAERNGSEERIVRRLQLVKSLAELFIRH